MIRIKFTFIAGMALLAIGVLIGGSANEVIGLLREVKIEMPPQVAAAIRAAFVVMAILIAAYIAYSGLIQPRKGD